MAWSADTDERVIAVRDWAENTGWHTWTDEYTNDEIAVLIQFTRSGEGAIKKFCRQVGITQEDLEPYVPEPSVVEMLPEYVGWERTPCPTCFIVPSVAGGCECASEDVKLRTFADPVAVPLSIEEKDAVTYSKDYERGWRAASRGDGQLDKADARGEVPAWYDGYHDRAAGRSKWSARRALASA